MKLLVRGKEHTVAEIAPHLLQIEVSADSIRDAIKAIINWDKCKPGYLQAITAVDEADKNIIVLYYLWWCHPLKRVVAVKTQIQRDTASIDSIVDIVPAARPYEMEVYDLLGVAFRGNKFLKESFLKPEELKGTYPLRKR